MRVLKDFFIFCSGANKSILRRTPTDVNKYVGIGATIFFTGIFAAIAAAYALFTVFDSYFMIAPIAIFWGLLIFNLDRFIVSTMKKRGSFWKDFKTAIPRLILAILIAIVIAKPLELKIFESEIQAELVKIEQENYKEQDDLVRLRYSNDIVAYKSDIASLKDEIKTKQLERDLLVNEAIAEADGTGGSQRKNLGPIYKTKKAAADKVQTELDNILTTNNALIVSKQSKIAQLNSDQSTAITALERSSMSGFAARIEGLERAANRSQAIWIANLFIMLLFIAVETAPVFSKLILQRGPYDFVLSKHEQLFEVDHKAFTSQQVNTTDSEIRFNNEMLDYKTKLAIIAEKELADDAIRRRIEELKGKTRLTPSFITKSSLLQ